MKRRHTNKEIIEDDQQYFNDAEDSAEWDKQNIEPGMSSTDWFSNLAGWVAIAAIVAAAIWFVLR